MSILFTLHLKKKKTIFYFIIKMTKYTIKYYISDKSMCVKYINIYICIPVSKLSTSILLNKSIYLIYDIQKPIYSPNFCHFAKDFEKGTFILTGPKFGHFTNISQKLSKNCILAEKKKNPKSTNFQLSIILDQITFFSYYY